MSLDSMVEKARRLLASGRVERVDEEHYNVIGNHGTYTVALNYEGKVTCNCPGFMSKGRCSHSAAIIILTQTSKYRRIKQKGKG